MADFSAPTGGSRQVRPAMLSVRGVDFSASAVCEDGSIAAQVAGTADLGTKKVLDDYLADLHKMATSNRVAKVVMDVRDLSFMNSSCLKGFVTWICLVQAAPLESRYRIALRSSPQIHWQRRSLLALSCLAADLVTVLS
jgi:hypothetical protein